ncbi:aminotransferase class I/II-fold pyridoxal phosphate-dependent enzyme [Nordella sp. HKS 07]|uniref:serine hydroxymethyltransferase n=1 Tax=Nordella sp. HKS 07 TaxID=2712222 RepID=UPI0013E13AC3|nr:aminotransferase class I/II-fold pyridoxal phosphate-dependent enzyme [Nordella sp. HKS 07]QIG51416.1 aminotransferase class I/II-fold pyridoxal phosphate-dependent enzyme [Nordella sp. HKS 07]
MTVQPIAQKSWLPADCATVIEGIESALGGLNDPAAIEARLMRLIDDHERHMDRESIGLNAGTNVMNPRAAALLARSLGNRPSLGYPGDKYEMGMEYAEEIEVIAEDLAKRLFAAPFAEIRVGSGALANLYSFMATAKSGDSIMAFTGEMGGHVTHHKDGAAGLYGLVTHPVPHDGERMTVDLDRLRADARRLRPKLITVAGSLCLYPYPVREMRQICDEVGAYLLYDAAHMGGLIAGRHFQAPLAEGAHLMTMSTYKAFGGPPSGLILSSDAELARRLDQIAYPGLTANFDLGKTAALALSILDLIAHGEAYAAQAIANANALGTQLEKHGIKVHRAQGRDATESHHLALPAQPYGGGQSTSKHLARANILLCGIGLPVAPVAGDLNGIRIGTQEVTRFGMKEDAMAEIAWLMSKVMVKGEAPEKVRSEVVAFRQHYQTMSYVR